MNFKHNNVLIALSLIGSLLTIAPSAHADNFTFSETINASVITGSFSSATYTGGNVVTDITNFSFESDLTPIQFGGLKIVYNLPLNFTSHLNQLPQQLTFTGQQNNIFFMNLATSAQFESMPVNNTTFNQYVNIGYTSQLQVGYPTNWVMKDTSISAVPEPETYGMMLAGLGLMGFMVRRKKSA